MNLSNKLTDSDIKDIVYNVNEKLDECFKRNDIIGSQVFKLLELNSRVLYYPLADDDIWGFIERIEGKLYACINTSIPYEKQIFAAAHELYHIWFDGENVQEVILSSNLESVDVSSIELNEQKANRFAAEFLAETNLLEQEMSRYKINKTSISTKEILLLCDVFTLPYKTIAKRMHEIGAIDIDRLSVLLATPTEEIEKWKTILGIKTPIKQDYIQLDNLVEKSIELYNKGMITYDKLDYLLGLANLSPDRVGITQIEYKPISDDEIAAILEEDDV